MALGNRIKETTTSTSTSTITLSGAAAGFRSFAAGLLAGATAVEVMVGPDSAGAWLIGSYTLTNSTTLTRNAIIDSSNGGSDVTLASGSKDVLNTITAATLSGFSSVRDVPFSQTVPLSQPGSSYMPQQTVSGAITFTPGAGAVRGALTYLRLVADGTNVPNFSAFKEWGGSLGYLNTAGIINQVQFFNDGYNSWFSVSQEVNAQPIPIPVTAVTLTGPAGGTVSQASGIFMVGVSPVGGIVMGNLVVTPSDNGGGGTFNPNSVTLTSAAPTANFTYTPGSVGSKSITVTNNGGLNNPAAASYNAAAPAPPRFSSLTRVAESGTGPYTYTGSGAGSGFGTTEGDSVLTTAFQSGTDGEVVIKCNVTPSNSTNELVYGVDPSNATGKKYNQLAYGMVGHVGSYDQFAGTNYTGSVTGSVGTAAGDYVRIRRMGSTLTMMYSKDSGATWNNAASWTGVSTGILYIHVLVTGVGSWTPISSVSLA